MTSRPFNDKYFKALYHSIDENIAIIDPKSFIVLEVNKISPGFKLEEVLGASVFKFTDPLHLESFRQLVMKVASTGVSGELEILVERRTNETGKAWYKITVSPVLSDNHTVENLLLISKDITESKLSDIRMRNKEERLFAIINNTEDIILSIDSNYCLTEYNSVFGKMVEAGFKKIDLIGSPLLNFIDPKKHEHLKNIYRRVFAGEAVNDIEKFETGAGRFIYFESGYNPIRDYKANIIGISIFSKNITERVYAEQLLKNALKEKEVLLSEIHHRVKNNLAMVSSMLQLKEMYIDNLEAKEVLSESRRRIKSTALVHEMLYKNEVFDRVLLKDYLVELLKNLNEDVELSIEGEDEFLSLGKALPFGLMMHELMMNSIKHSFKGKAGLGVIIKTENSNGNLKIAYSDRAGSFPDEIDFNDTSTTGLMLIHTFIEQLNGKINITSKNPPAYLIEIPIIE